ncbi:substrate-binding domain-containing protein [Uliginosibacterium paludis]|uniref:Substrate-binding domain-containing protein n=1 Tax=Uliginosibacterium paludis TaxID=1615952 RepID=A0ABV2CSY9_9RHOO
MRSRRTRSVLLILDSSMPFHRDVMRGIGAFVHASELGWHIRVARKIPASFERIDGIIADVETPGLEQLMESPPACPMVFIGSAESAGLSKARPRVCANNAAMVELAVNHLRENGLTSLACFSLVRYQSMPWARERIEAFRVMAGASAGVQIGGLSDSRQHEERAVEWLRSLPPRTGVVAVNDSTARELLQMCAAAGRSVPRDIAVVGIDNDPLAAALSPLTISSVMQASEEIGRKACDMLRRRMVRPDEMPADLAVAPQGLQLAATSSKSSALVRGAMDFIEAQLGRCIKAQQVADYMGVSRATLERTFLSQLGVTVHDELLNRRIAQAKLLLQRRELSTAEIARQCGFRTQQYMHVVFKRELGMSPVEFAQSAAPASLEFA